MSKYAIVVDARYYLGLFTATEEPWAYGGAEIQMSYLIKGFAAQGVPVILLGNDSSPEIDVPGVEYCRIPKYFQSNVPKPLRLINLWFSRWPRQLIERGKSQQLIYFQTQDECIRMTRNAKRHGVKVVRWVNLDALVDGMGFHSERTIRANDVRLSLADSIVAQNKYQQSNLSERYNRHSTIIDSMHSDIKPYWGARDNTILWAARCDPIKNPEEFFELAAQMLSYKFVMVMPPSKEEFFERYQRMASILPNVTFIPGEPNNKLIERYKKASIHICTSHSEGFPNTFIESMLCGTPVATLKLDLDGSMVPENGAFCAGDNLKIFREYIASVVSDSALQSELGKRAYDYAAARFDNNKVISTYLRLFEEVVDG